MGNSSNQGKGVDAMSVNFLMSVNEEMSRQASIRYLDIHKSLHGNMEFIRDAIDRGVPADKFVENVIKNFGLMKTNGNVRPEIVHGFNKTQAAICEFAMGSREWQLRTEGVVFREGHECLGSLRPVKQLDSDQFGFGTFFHDGASLGPDGRAQDMPATAEPISGNGDIMGALDVYEERRGHKHAPENNNRMSM
jgi:hypothetical protein